MPQIKWDDEIAESPMVQWDKPVNTALGKAKQAVQTGINYVDTLGGKLPGTPAGSFITPESVNQVPGNLTEAGGQIGQAAIPGGRLARSGLGRGWQALTRIVGPAIGGEAGNQLEGGPTGQGALTQGAGAAVGEVASATGGAALRSMGGGKGRIDERMSKDLVGALTDLNPAVGPAVKQAQVSPLLRGGKTAAKLQTAVGTGDLQGAMSQRHQQALNEVEAISGPLAFNTPGVRRAYDRLPDLVKEEVIGPIGPQGLTLQQALEVRSYLSSSAFKMSPQGQGVTPVAQQKLWERMTGEIEAAIPPQALPIWKKANQEYGVQSVLEDANRFFRGGPNEMGIDRNVVSKYLADNREDVTRRLGGPEQYSAFVNRALNGAQPGTRDILASGGGHMLDAARQTVGRGTNSGAMGYLGVPLRTALPNVGSQYTGRQPYTLPPMLQQALDAVLQRQAGGMTP